MATKMKCPRGQAWDTKLKKCVDIDSESQSVMGYSIKGGVNWFGEDSPMEGEYEKERRKSTNPTGKNVFNTVYTKAKKLMNQKIGGSTKATYKTGGMVNANAKLVATKSAGSKGVKSGVNPKAAASSTAKKPSKPRSKAPKKAAPGRK